MNNLPIEVSPDGHPVVGGDWSGKTVIDVGCRGGQFCRFAQQHGCKVIHGFDGNGLARHTVPEGVIFHHSAVVGAIHLDKEGGLIYGTDSDWVTDMVMTEVSSALFPNKHEHAMDGYSIADVLFIYNIKPKQTILKLDCEGSEYGILFDVLALPFTFAQITVEFHAFLGLEPFEGARATIDAAMAVRYNVIPVAHLVPKGPGDEVTLWVNKE